MNYSIMRAELYQQGIPKVPDHVSKIFADMLSVIPGIIHKFKPRGAQNINFKDCSATAIMYGLKRAQNISTKKPESKTWTRMKWETQIKSAFKVGVLEGIHNLIYPLRLPRPLRLSIKKYLIILEFLEPYVDIEYIEGSRLYKALFVDECPVLCADLRACSLGYSNCALPTLSAKDRKRLHMLLRYGKGSLAGYAERYRKTLPEWVTLIQEYRKVTLQTVKVPDIVIKEPTEDIDSKIVLNKFRQRLEEIDPRLFELYCLAFSEVDVNDLFETNTLFFPKAWAAKTIKGKYPELGYEECKSLLEQGDIVLNEFRKKYGSSGLSDIQRTIS